MIVQVANAHGVSTSCTKLNRGEMFGDELGGGLFPGPPRLVAPRDGFELAEPFAQAALSSRSILCLEASTEFACTPSVFPVSHHSAKSRASKDQCPLGPHGWRAPGIRPCAASFVQCRFGKPYGAISSVGLRLRNEGLITSIWRDGQFMWARPGTATQFIAARDAIVEALKKGPMTVSALARETGKGIPTIKSAVHRHLLANQTVIRTKFGVYALAGTQSPYVSRGDAIVAALKKGPMMFSGARTRDQ
jgi:hypothetical protein